MTMCQYDHHWVAVMSVVQPICHPTKPVQLTFPGVGCDRCGIEYDAWRQAQPHDHVYIPLMPSMEAYLKGPDPRPQKTEVNAYCEHCGAKY